MSRTTSPLHMRAVLQRLEAQKLSDTDTQEIPIVKPPQVEQRATKLPSMAVGFTIPSLPRDRLGRPYVRVADEKGYTLELVQAAVQRFIEVQQCAPTVILLSAWRWLEFGISMGFYYPCTGQPIPYGYEPLSGTYDILVRGAFDGN